MDLEHQASCLSHNAGLWFLLFYSNTFLLEIINSKYQIPRVVGPQDVKTAWGLKCASEQPVDLTSSWDL